ncbi:hypothetical protein AAFN86_27065 [Roseomonas sp. CAU 1739]|uniref:hypothetical protein n=1 Tax=Roseomonas sp. CAU 1739 TaxID=3140364 RepID=UPI00325B0268
MIDDEEPGMTSDDLRREAWLRVADAVSSIVASQEDIAAVEDLLAQSSEARRRRISSLSAGAWAIIARAVGRAGPQPTAGLWAATFVAAVPNSSSDLHLVGAALAAFALLSEADATSDAAAARCISHMVAPTEAQGRSDLAYDLVAIALELASDDPTERLGLAQRGLALGQAAGKAHQAAACATEAALCLAQLAAVDPGRRLAAFDATDLAVEWILASDMPFREIFGDRLATGLREPANAGLRILGDLMMPHLNPQAKAEVEAQQRGYPWPRRVEVAPRERMPEYVLGQLGPMTCDIEVYRQRLALLPSATRRNPTADWVDWTLAHPGYLQAVPHNHSFLREKHARGNLLDLAHEITHVMTLLGGIGGTLTALRAALLIRQAARWSAAARDMAEVDELIRVGSALPPLDAAEPRNLPLVELSLELLLKSQALQDSWTPWFEGLAVFGETAADPALDPIGIHPVAEALRALVDYRHPESSNDAAREAKLNELATDFETHVSEAMQTAAPSRLRHLLGQRDVPYFAGYLAVRAVVACWRRTMGQPLDGAKAFGALLYLTRYAVEEAIPDLSLHSARFAQEAESSMSQWAAAMASLPAESLALILQGPSAPNEAGPRFLWSGGRPQSVTPEQGEEIALQRLRQRVIEALRGSRGSVDLARHGPPGTPARELAEAAMPDLEKADEDTQYARTIENTVQMATAWLGHGQLLPIGRADARFFLLLDSDPSASIARLTLTIRTAEMNADGSGASVNGISIPLPADVARRLAKAFEARRTPTMEVVRVVDLSQRFVDSMWPVLLLRYGDWVHVEGPAGMLPTELAEKPEARQNFANQLRQRLWPDDRYGLDAVGRGALLARQALGWFDASSGWAQSGSPFEPWAFHVRGLATSILDDSVRASRQKRAGCALLAAVGLDASIETRGFNELVPPADRAETVAALFRSARMPISDPWLDTNAPRLALRGFDVFSWQNDIGWDVRPLGGRESS